MIARDMGLILLARGRVLVKDVVGGVGLVVDPAVVGCGGISEEAVDGFVNVIPGVFTAVDVVHCYV